MKKVALLASVAVGFSALAAPAFAQTVGSVGVNYAQDIDESDLNAWGVDGGLAMSLSGNLALLLDASYSTQDDLDIDSTTASAHLLVRDANSAWGGYIGLAQTDTGVGDADAVGVGVEYASFMQNATLALALGYATDDDNDVDATGVSAEYRIFASDNLRFDIGGAYAKVDAGGSDGDGTSIGAGVEYRFANSPISIGARLSHLDSDAGDSDTIGVSLRYDFGTGSLKERDRKGNTFGSFGGIGGFL